MCNFFIDLFVFASLPGHKSVNNKGGNIRRLIIERIDCAEYVFAMVYIGVYEEMKAPLSNEWSHFIFLQ